MKESTYRKTTLLATLLALSFVGWLTSLPTHAAYIVESRAGGLNFDEYSESGSWSNNTGKSAAAGLTAGIGSRVVSTFREGVGEQHAFFTPDLPETGVYEVSATWGNMSARRNPILYQITHSLGTADVDIDQTATANEWVSLGQYVFTSGTSGRVGMNNLHIDEPGIMAADAVKWDLIQVILAPEPPTYALIGLGSLGVCLAGRRHSSRRRPGTR